MNRWMIWVLWNLLHAKYQQTIIIMAIIDVMHQNKTSPLSKIFTKYAKSIPENKPVIRNIPPIHWITITTSHVLIHDSFGHKELPSV